MDEKLSVKKHLGVFLHTRRLPGKEDIEKCLQQEEALKNRSWRNVKDFIRNQIGKKDPMANFSLSIRFNIFIPA